MHMCTLVNMQSIKVFKITHLCCNVTICNNSVQVKKIDIDDYAPGRTSWIPHSYFKAKLLMGESTSNIDTSDFECNISMIGAKEPYNKFNIDISPSQGMFIVIRCYYMAWL